MKWVAALAVGLAAGGGGAAFAADGGRSFVGDAVVVGEGDARVVVDTDGQGRPVAVAVVMSEAALSGLPGPAPDRPDWEYVLPMPEDAPQTGYNHVGLNWNPGGHEPHGIYTVPHFDVHFYLVGQDEREVVTFQGPQAAEAGKQPPANLLPEGYALPPGTGVERMGAHALDPNGPEFKGEPFTRTFIYGYHKGELTFLEPMVSTAFLSGKPNVTDEIRRPEAYSRPAYYPTRYRIGHDPEGRRYVIAMEGLTPWRMDQISSLPRK